MEQVLKQIGLDQLVPGRFQPRSIFPKGEIEDLAASIRKVGIVEPLVVRAKSETQYEIIAGERRWRAAGLAGLLTVPCVVKDADDQLSAQMTLIENLQREDLNAIDEARGFRRAMDVFSWTQEELADHLGKGRATVTNALRLLDGLSEATQEMIRVGQLDASFGRELLRLEKHRQLTVALQCVNNGWKRDRLIRAIDEEVRFDREATGQSDPNVKRLERRLTEHLGSPARIQRSAGGGKLVLQFGSLEELDGILVRMGYKDAD